MCGEHCKAVLLSFMPVGSSPHVRGTLLPKWAQRNGDGIFPACAGNTLVELFDPRLRRDHPRMCGEHTLIFQALLKLRGSSPHVRGTQSASTKSYYRRGIIPACAGNTWTIWKNSSRTRDHPRMCGEHRHLPFLASSLLESSPHVRGTQIRRFRL